MKKNTRCKRALVRKKSGAICPDCGNDTVIMSTTRKVIDTLSRSTLVTRYVKCACGFEGVNESHTKPRRCKEM